MQDLLRQLSVLFRSGRIRRVGEDRFLVRRALFQTDVLADDGLEDFVAENLVHLLLNIARQVGALVEERNHDAQQLELGIGPGAHALERFQQIVGSFQRVIAGLNRDQQVRGGHQGVHRHDAEGGRRVNEDHVEVFAHRRQHVLEAERRVKLAHQIRFQLCQRDLGRHQAKVGAVGRLDDFGKRQLMVRQHVVNRMRNLFQSEKGHGAVGLGIEVDQEGPLLLLGESGSEVDGGGGFPDAALLIFDRYDRGQSVLRPRVRQPTDLRVSLRRPGCPPGRRLVTSYTFRYRRRSNFPATCAIHRWRPCRWSRPKPWSF